jgi:hypothetical protein
MMVVDARDRQQLRERLEATLGERPAEVLMEHLFDEGASDVGTQLAGLDLRLVEMGERMDAMGERMDAMGERMDAMLVLFEQRFDAIDRRFVSLETRMGGLEIRMESVEERLGRMEPGLEKLDDRTHTVLRTVMTSFLVTTFSSWGLVLAAMALT